MKRICRKLHSQRGVTMLLALAFFLVCLCLGSVILTAATASAAKERDRYSRQQAYLAVASAARLLKGELGDSYYLDLTEEARAEAEAAAAEAVAAGEEPDRSLLDAYPQSSDPAGNLLLSAWQEGTRSAVYILSADDDALPEVTVQMVMDDAGNASFTLTAPDGEGNACYSTVVTFPATPPTDDNLTGASWSVDAVTIVRGENG